MLFIFYLLPVPRWAARNNPFLNIHEPYTHTTSPQGFPHLPVTKEGFQSQGFQSRLGA